MSVRAYRVNKIEMKDEPSFNITHNQKFLDFMAKHNVYFDIGNEIVEVSISVLEEWLNSEEGADKCNEDITEQIMDDVAFAKANGEHYVLYGCF